MREITKDGIKKYKHYLSVADLKAFIEKHNVPDDARVLIQRIEDVYYEKHGWGVYKKKTSIGNIEGESQYHPAWCCLQYTDDEDNLFIDLHY